MGKTRKSNKKKSIKRKSIKRTPYVYMSVIDKDENRLLEKIHNCKTKHCSKELDQLAEYSVVYEKAHNIACPTSMKDDSFINCDSTFYKNSDHEKYLDNVSKCGKKHCDKYAKSLRNHRDKLIFKELNIPQTIGKLLVSK